MQQLSFLLLFFFLAGCGFVGIEGASPTQAAVSTLPTSEAAGVNQADEAAETAVSQPALSLLPTPRSTATPRPAYLAPEGAGRWTILIYMAADNELDVAAEPLLNELESLILPEGVTVLLQIDRRNTGLWSEGRRYRLVGDEDLAFVSSELLDSLGEVNMGDPRVLADFVAWGVQNFPARQTAVMLWGHGGGWRGLLVDEATDIGQPDDLSLSDVTGGLNLAFDASGLDKLDLLVLDAPLMNSLTVAEQLAPLAESLLLPTGAGWLTQLEGEETIDIRGGTLLDLTAVSWLAHRVELLAFELARFDVPLATIVASSPTQPLGDPLLDVATLAAIFSMESFPPDVQVAARQLGEALETAVLAQRGGNRLELTMSTTAEFGQTTNLANWASLLQGADSSPANVSLHSVWRQTVGLQQPAYFEYEVAGAGLNRASLVVFEETENGRFLRQTRYLGEGVGVQQDFVIWFPTAPFVEDGAGNGAFVVGEQQPAGDWWVTAHVRRANAAVSQAAKLHFDVDGRLTAVWMQGATEAGLWRQSSLQAGDALQVVEQVWEEDGLRTTSSGLEISVAADNGLLLTQNTLPDGRYLVGVQDTAQAQDLTLLTIQNESVVQGFDAYLDPRYAFQFRYPADWAMPTISETLVLGGSGETRLQIRSYPELAAETTLGQLRDETLTSLGDIDILYENETAVGGVQGRQVAYGYEDPELGARTGQFLLIINGVQGAVIDLDGPQSAEAETLAISQAIGESWEFVLQVVEAPQWTTAKAAGWSIAFPVRFELSEANGWQKFSVGSDTFLALREQPFEESAEALLAQVVADAGAGLDDFASETTVSFGVGTELWQRVDFRYGAIEGFIAMLPLDDRVLIAWAEGLEAGFEGAETAVFRPMLASLRFE